MSASMQLRVLRSEDETSTAAAPFTAWPDPDAGFRVLDLRTMTWAAGPFHTVEEAVAAMDRLNQQARADKHAGPKGTILVVDDDTAIVDFIAMALEDRGYRVLTAIDGAALQIAADQHPTLILLDIMMPIMDGVEVSRRLRADPRTAAIPIVAMSAKDRLQATGMPVDDRLPKPFNLYRLVETVGRWATPA